MGIPENEKLPEQLFYIFPSIVLIIVKNLENLLRFLNSDIEQLSLANRAFFNALESKSLKFLPIGRQRAIETTRSC